MSESPPQTTLAIALTTQDSMRTIERVLTSVADLADRIVIVDSGSTDGTIECCRSFGAEVIHRDWDGPTRQKQFAMDQCHDCRWILLLDSDESLEQPLVDSIRRVITEDDSTLSGWSFNRKIWFLGGWLNHTFQPEWRLRLVRNDNYTLVGIGPGGRGGHDRVVVEGRVGKLDGFCCHDSWVDLKDMCLRYVNLGKRAGEYEQRGGTCLHILISPVAAFLKQYLIKRGVLDGPRGLIASGGAAVGTFIKHLFIAERKMKRRGGDT